MSSSSRPLAPRREGLRDPSLARRRPVPPSLPPESKEDHMHRLDKKLAKIRSGKYAKGDFIIADAKDGDMSNPFPGTGPIRAADGSFAPIPHQSRIPRKRR